MTYLLGIDTGGTYTDAVILREESEVIASAKSLTTREDLALGIGCAVQSVLSASAISAAQISMASLSTTLATNALVEGQGDRVSLIYIGFRDGDVAKNGLFEALKATQFWSSRAVTAMPVLKYARWMKPLCALGSRHTMACLPSQWQANSPREILRTSFVQQRS